MKRFSLFLLILLLTATAPAASARSRSKFGTVTPPLPVLDPGGHTRYIKDVAFTADGRQLISAGDDKVIRVWDVASGSTVRTIRGETGPGGVGTIYALALSADNKFLAVGGIFPGTLEESFAIRLHDFQSGRVIALLTGHGQKVTALDFSRDGRSLVSGSDDNKVLVWDVAAYASGRAADAPRLVGSHRNTVSAVAFSPDGSMVVSGGDDALVQLWDLRQAGAGEGRPRGEMTRHGFEPVETVAFSPDGRYVASGGRDKRIFLWGWKGGEVRELGQMKSDVLSLTFAPGGLSLVAGARDGSCNIIAIPSGKVGAAHNHDDAVWAVAFAPDGKTVASAGGYNAQVALWDVATGKPVGGQLTGVGQTVWSVGFAADGKAIAFGNMRASDEVNAFGPLQHVLQLAAGDTYRVALANDLEEKERAGFVGAVTKVGDKELRLKAGPRVGGSQLVSEAQLEVVEGQTVRTTIWRRLSTGSRHRCFTFTHDGSFIISGGESGKLTIYDAETGQSVGDFHGHTNDVLAVAVSPDNRYLVSGSSDQTVRLWDLRSLQNLLTIFVSKDRQWVAWTPHGYYTSSLSGDRFVGWQVNRGVRQTPEFYTATQFRAAFDRPDVVGWFLAVRNIKSAVQLAEEHRKDPNDPQLIGDETILKSLPPGVTYVLSPEPEGGKVRQSALKLKVEVLSKTLPITTARVWLNGFARGTFRGDPDDKQGGLRMTFEMLIPLEQGENTLAIVASNTNASSQPKLIKIVYEPAGGSDARKFEEGAGSGRRPGPLPAVAPVSFVRANYFARGVAPDPAAAAPRQQPPTLDVLSPAEPSSTVNNKNLKVKVAALSENSPTDIEVKIGGERALFFRVSSKGEPSDDQFITLSPGDNEVTFTAYNGDIKSETVIRKVKYVEVNKPKLVFLGIGISKYKDFQPPLQFADKDAEELAKTFIGQGGGADSYFGEVKVKVLSNDQVTREAIINHLNWLNDEAKSEKDVRVVLLSGHAGLRLNNYYFYSHVYKQGDDPEINSIGSDTFWKKLKENTNTKLLFLVDTCRAGGAAPDDFLKDAPRSNAVFIASSSADKDSKEYPDKQHGYLTWAMLEAIRGLANDNDDRFVDSGELATWIMRKVRRLTGDRQIPVILVPPSSTPFTISACPSPSCPKETP